MSLSKTLYPLLSTCSTQEERKMSDSPQTPDMAEKLLIGK